MTRLHSILLLTFFALASADRSSKTYVKENSVDCTSTGVYFQLDNTISELYIETHFNINLYTANDTLVEGADFDRTTGKVSLPYSKYVFEASTAYGPSERPLLYDIEQPFFAVPTIPTTYNRNYTFGVYCVVPASYDIHVVINTTDDGHGDHGGDVVNPKDHIAFNLTYAGTEVRPVGEVALGDALKFRVYLLDDTYAGFMPITCKYFNPNNKAQYLPFVQDSCPRDLGSVDDFGYMTRVNGSYYEITFKTFAFETSPSSLLGLNCDVLLCIQSNVADCDKGCWHPGQPTSQPASTQSSASTESTLSTESSVATESSVGTSTELTSTQAETTSSTASTSEIVTEAATTESLSSEPPSTSSEISTVTSEGTTSTEQPSTSNAETTVEKTTVTSEPSTSAAEPTSESTEASTISLTTEGTTIKLTTAEAITTTEGTTVEPTTVVRKRRSIPLNDEEDSSSSFSRSKRALPEKDKPVSVPVNYEMSFGVKLPDGNPTAAPSWDKTCADNSLLSALYGIIGGLCALMVVLVLALVYVTITMRRRKEEQRHMAY